MTMGPGKYDDAATLARDAVGITDDTGGAVLLIVLGGNKGDGFSCQADLGIMLALPDLLESVARQIRETTLV